MILSLLYFLTIPFYIIMSFICLQLCSMSFFRRQVTIKKQDSQILNKILFLVKLIKSQPKKIRIFITNILIKYLVCFRLYYSTPPPSALYKLTVA